MASYQVLTNIQIQQIPNDKYPDRSKFIVFSFLNQYEGTSTWEWLTQKMSLVLPKKVNVKAYNSKQDYLSGNPNAGVVYFGLIDGQFANLGGFGDKPTFLKGDLITFNVGYRAILMGQSMREETYMTGQNGIPNQFEGVISSIQPKLPFTLECEDYMWLLKQVPTPAKHWPGYTLQDIVTECINNAYQPQVTPTGSAETIISKYKRIAGIDLTVSTFDSTTIIFNVGNFVTTYGSVAMLLDRIKTQYKYDSYFRGMQLRMGLLHYIPSDVTMPYPVFTFQQNIIEDKLKWQRMDDLVLSTIVKANYLKEGAGTTIDGQPKTVHGCTEVLVYNFAGAFTYQVKQKGVEFPKNEIGERFDTQIFSPITDPVKLFEIGKAQLEKKYYDGFKGSFTTFGVPYIKHGDTIRIIDATLKEREGLYKVKAVNFKGGFEDGLRQEIFLDYKIPA